MAAKTFAEALGAGQRIKKVFASDGTVRKIKKIYASTGGLANLVFSAEDDLTMTVTVSGNVAGFTQGGFGGMVPTVLGDGTQVNSLLLSSAAATPNPNQMQLFLLNYPGTITAAYIASISINGSFMPMSGSNFSFSGGAPGGGAQFTWQNQGGVYSATHGGFTVPIIIVRS